jgi:hypothetical protein
VFASLALLLTAFTTLGLSGRALGEERRYDVVLVGNKAGSMVFEEPAAETAAP